MKIITSLILIVFFRIPCISNSNNIADYVFTQSTGVFTSTHTTGTYITAGCTSSVFGNLPIGFTFIYNGNAYTQFGLCCGGWISLGPGVPGTSIYPLSTGTANNVIAPFAAQLTSTVAGDGIYYKTEGSAPNRVLTVEWWQYGFWLNGFDEICFQIKLFETSNEVRFVYTTNDELSIRTVQVGLRGASNTDFNNRQTTTNWLQTTAGTANTASCLFSPGITPQAGLTFIFTPPPVKIKTINTSVPEELILYQNYPNPFNPSTKIQFSIPVSAKTPCDEMVSLIIHNVSGQEITTLVNEKLKAGTYEIEWNASRYPSGIYFYRLITSNFTETKKMVLMK